MTGSFSSLNLLVWQYSFCKFVFLLTSNFSIWFSSQYSEPKSGHFDTSIDTNSFKLQLKKVISPYIVIVGCVRLKRVMPYFFILSSPASYLPLLFLSIQGFVLLLPLNSAVSCHCFFKLVVVMVTKGWSVVYSSASFCASAPTQNPKRTDNKNSFLLIT